MSFYVDCSSGISNTGINNLCQDLGTIAGYMLCPRNFSLSEVNARLKASWETAILADKANRVYPFPPSLGMTDNSEETVYQDFALGKLFVKDGKTILQFTHASSRYKHAALKSHSGKGYSVILFDTNGRMHGIVGDTPDTFKAINLSELTVGKLVLNDGSSQGTSTPVTMTFENPTEWEEKPAVIAGLDWSPSDLMGLIDLKLSLVGAATTTGFTLNVVGNRTNQPFSGVVGDFDVKDSAGVTQSITSVTADEGTHVFTMTLSAGTYTVNLKAPANMTTAGYDSVGAVEFTVA